MKKTLVTAFIVALLLPMLAYASGQITVTYNNGSSQSFNLQQSPSNIKGISVTTIQDTVGFPLGSVWKVQEACASTTWYGTWTRRPGTETFDAHWKSDQGEVRDVIHYRGLNGNTVTLFRDGIRGTYTGKVSFNNRSISNGTLTWNAGCRWSATIQ